MDIDLVYLWCSDSDSEFSAQKSAQKKKFYLWDDSVRADRRTMDHNELRYSLRSVEKFAPWVRKIFIVTNHQVPDWLNLNHPKIQIVDHRDIIPDEYLPTFNSNVIETFLHKIPGLSEHFLCANDDTFFSNKTDPDFFFTPDGKPIHHIQFMDKYASKSYWYNILHRAQTLAEMDTRKKCFAPACLPSHNIDPYTKSLYADTVSHFWSVYQESAPNTFRKENDISRFLVSCWGNLTDRLVWNRTEPTKTYYFDRLDKQTLQSFLSKDLPNLCCLNDNDFLTDEDYQCQTTLYQTLFPTKSDFEKNDIIVSKKSDTGLMPAFPKNNIPLVFVVDDVFLPYLAVTIQSILKHISSRYNYDIILLYANIHPENMKMLTDISLPKNVRIQKMDIHLYCQGYIRTVFKDFDTPKMMRWSKIFLPKLLPNYSKVIYLDSDLLVKCNIAELWDFNMGKNAVAGVLDVAAHSLNSPKKEHMMRAFRCDGIDDYINLGVMIMDLDALRKMDFTQKILNLVTSVPPKIWNLYDIFNAVLHQNIALLPMDYNLQYGITYKAQTYSFFKDDLYLEFQKSLRQTHKIMHFTAIKPWVKIMGQESQNWWNLAKETNFYEMILLASR